MKPAQNIVYFLGAGNSFNFGYPLTSRIMPDILSKLKEGKLFFSGENNRRLPQDALLEKKLWKYIKLAYPGLANVDLKKEKGIPNITEIFSFVDHLCFYNTPHHPALKEEKLTEFRVLLSRALGELLQQYEYLKPTPNQKKIHKTFISSIKNQLTSNKVTIITTNYDLSIDSYFTQEIKNHKVDFGIPYRDLKYSVIRSQPNNPSMYYYKLHGSLNWLMCTLCGQYYINPYWPIVHQEYRKKIDDDNNCVCNKEMRLKSVMVPPSIVRDIRDSNLLQIWKGALEAIRLSDKIIMIGYSLPAEDLAIKSVILRGLNGRKKKAIPELEIIQYGEEAKPNYRNVFGKVFKSENYYSKGLDDYLKAKYPHLNLLN